MATDSRNKIDIRPLNTKDFWTMVNVIKKGGVAAMQRMSELKNGTNEERGFFLLDVGLEYAQPELMAFFADLAGMTVEEFENGDFDFTLTVIEQLIEREDLGTFIKRVGNLAAKLSPNQAAAAPATVAN